MSQSDLQRQRAEKHFQEGLTKLKQSKFRAALAAFDRTIQLAPGFPEPWMFRGAVKINYLDDLHGGIADCDVAIRFLSNHPMAHANRGIAFLKLERYQPAADDFGVALLAAPLDGNLHRMKGYCHYKLEQYAQGVTHYSAAIRFWHEKALCYDMRGVCYFCLHEFDNALDDFNESIRLDATRLSTYTNRGVLYTQRGEYEQALADHNTALAVQPESWYYSNRGMVYLMQGNLAQAASDCNTALEIDSRAADAYGLRGQLHFLRGDFEAALADFERMEMYKEPGDGHALAAQSIVYHAMGQTVKALNLWRLLVTENVGYGDIRWLEDEMLLAAPLMAEVSKIVAGL